MQPLTLLMWRNSARLRPRGLWTPIVGQQMPRGPELPAVEGRCAHPAPSPSSCVPVRYLLHLGLPPWPAGGGVVHQVGAQFTDGYTCCLLTSAPRGLLPVVNPVPGLWSAPATPCTSARSASPQEAQAAPNEIVKIVESPFKAHGNYFQGFIVPESRATPPPPPARKAPFHHQGHDPGYLQTVMRLSTARCGRK